ncbi:MAG: hypothetical protein AAGI48_09875 [Verrucomicrobiota bacterium]
MNRKLLTLALLAVACISGTLLWLPSQKDGGNRSKTEEATNAGADPAGGTAEEASNKRVGTPVQPVPGSRETRPTEPPSVVSREEIIGVTSQEEAARIHQQLATHLIDHLLGMEDVTDRDRVRVATQGIAEQFYLLDRTVKARGLETPGEGSLDRKEEDRVNRLVVIWQRNPDLGITVDRLFQERGILDHEHVPYSLRVWIKSENSVDPKD